MYNIIYNNSYNKILFISVINASLLSLLQLQLAHLCIIAAYAYYILVTYHLVLSIL